MRCLGFYQDQNEAGKQIDIILSNSKLSKTDVNIPNLVLQITNLYCVSQRFAEKRVQLWCEANSIRVKGRVVVMPK